jgi:hypothetical protein
VCLIPQAHQLWISNEQVIQAYIHILRLNGETDAAAAQERTLQALIQAKAARIAESCQRQAYLKSLAYPSTGLPLAH